MTKRSCGTIEGWLLMDDVFDWSWQDWVMSLPSDQFRAGDEIIYIPDVPEHDPAQHLHHR